MDQVSEIEVYLCNYLSPLLSRFGVSEEFTIDIIENVRLQIYSFYAHWNDVEFRNALYVIGLEEGMFYEPMSPINPFVVVAIRNSLVETIQSEGYEKANLSRNLGDDAMKAITTQAIEYFMNVNMDEMCNQVLAGPSDDSYDLYGLAARKYPLAWAALMKIGNSASNAITYPEIAASHHPDVFAQFVTTVVRPISLSKPFVSDGYSADIEDELKAALRYAVSDGAIFFADSFKSVTRNFKKLLCVIEYVLYNRRSFVTCNYYIANGYIAKRSPLLRASHNINEQRRNLENMSGLRKTHREVIQCVLMESKYQKNHS